MTLGQFLGKQFIRVIEWNEPEDGILAYRFPMRDLEIENGGKLTVSESQMAAFVNEGKIADVFTPGLYTLNTRNLPLLTDLINRLFQRLPGSRRSVFEALDRPAMRALPPTPLCSPSGKNGWSPSITTSMSIGITTAYRMPSLAIACGRGSPPPPSRCSSEASAWPVTCAPTSAARTQHYLSTCPSRTARTPSGRRNA